MSKRPAGKSLPQYGLKESDFPSKKAWQTARAKKAGYSSYYDWLKERRTEGVQRTNLGKASETYKAKAPTKKKFYSQRREMRLRDGKVLGEQYYFNVKRDGWEGFNRFMASLDKNANVIVRYKQKSGRVQSFDSRRPAGVYQRRQREGGSGEDSPLAMEIRESSWSQSPKTKKGKKGKEITRESDPIEIVYVLVYGKSTVKKYG